MIDCMHCYVFLSNVLLFRDSLLIYSLLANQGPAKKARPVKQLVKVCLYLRLNVVSYRKFSWGSNFCEFHDVFLSPKFYIHGI